MGLVTAAELEKLKTSGQPLLVDYFATWCGPCKTLVPRLEDLEGDYPNVKFVKVNGDENTDHSIQMGIRSVPTVIFYKNGSEINRSSGANSNGFYKEILNGL
jgi:thioredoxin 1